MAKKFCYDNLFVNVFRGEEKLKTREDKRMVKLESYLKLPFLNID